MDLLLIFIYIVLCIGIFKFFKIFFNKWIVLIVVFGGVVLIGVLILLMNYNYLYLNMVSSVYVIMLIVLNVCGIVEEVVVKLN